MSTRYHIDSKRQGHCLTRSGIPTRSPAPLSTCCATSTPLWRVFPKRATPPRHVSWGLLLWKGIVVWQGEDTAIMLVLAAIQTDISPDDTIPGGLSFWPSFKDKRSTVHPLCPLLRQTEWPNRTFAMPCAVSLLWPSSILGTPRPADHGRT